MIIKLLALLVILHTCYAPPVTKNKKEETEEKDSKIETDGLEDYVEYHRYIREVVNALESDPTFREKLENAKEEDIKSGKIANDLELVSHHVRTRLDEIKRSELGRLKDLVEKRKELTENNHNNNIEDPTHHHVDHVNPHTFEIEDLKRLIAKTTEDLAEADTKRRADFKEYELQKELDKFEKLNHTSGEAHEKLEHDYKELEDKHRKHDKLHEPGHKKQIEEVWEEQDHMQQDFNPKAFFMLHDLDSNGFWDQEEVKALFVLELNKMYAAGSPEDDMRERVEEMERMRESVFREMDLNRDGFIDFNEFLQQTKKTEYEKDNGWQGIDENKPYSDEELQEYIKQHQQYPPHPNDVYNNQGPPSGYQQGYQGHAPPQGGHMQPSQGGYMPPQGGHMQPPPGGYMPPQGGQMPQYQGQQHPQQVPQYQQQQGHAPQYQQQQGQVPQQYQAGQMPQVQVSPQNMNNQAPPVPNPSFPNNNQGLKHDLNTNEIHPNNQQPNLQPNQQTHQQKPNNPPQKQTQNENNQQQPIKQHDINPQQNAIPQPPNNKN